MFASRKACANGANFMPAVIYCILSLTMKKQPLSLLFILVFLFAINYANERIKTSTSYNAYFEGNITHKSIGRGGIHLTLKNDTETHDIFIENSTVYDSIEMGDHIIKKGGSLQFSLLKHNNKDTIVFTLFK